MIKGANGALNRQASAFLPVGNIYAPYYRQADATYVLTMPTIKEQDEAVRIKPAANVLLFILSELRKKPEVYKRMVAAYAIGFSVTKDYLSENNNDTFPKLKFATGPDDTGVIISYNTEAPEVNKNPVVRQNSLAINPISWTTTNKPASKESNAGSITPITPALSDLTPVKNLASAQVDVQRGVVICNSVDIKKYSLPGFPGVYHSFDYPFYFYNIRENAMNRVQKYFATHNTNTLTYKNQIVLEINNPKMNVNGTEYEIDPGKSTAPTYIKGKTCLPITALIEKMGGTVDWQGSENKITINFNSKKIELWINSLKTKVNGEEKAIEVAPQTINGKTMIPLRYIIENLGLNLIWDSQTQQIIIQY